MRVTRSDGGFSLVEVLVSILLLGFVALGIQSALTSAIRQNRLALERTEATGLAAARMAQITSMPFKDAAHVAAYALPGETVGAGAPATLSAGYGAIPGQPQFSRTVTLTYNSPVAGLLRVQVDVNWIHRGQNAQKTHRMITFIHPSLTTGGG